MARLTIYYYLYADDTQFLQEFIVSDKTTPEIAIRKMELCVASISGADM